MKALLKSRYSTSLFLSLPIFQLKSSITSWSSVTIWDLFKQKPFWLSAHKWLYAMCLTIALFMKYFSILQTTQVNLCGITMSLKRIRVHTMLADLHTTRYSKQNLLQMLKNWYHYQFWCMNNCVLFACFLDKFILRKKGKRCF